MSQTASPSTLSSFSTFELSRQYWQGAPVVWAMGGSDCTGGAGIQADTKTIHNLGGLANTIITAVTAQNAGGVKEINAVAHCENHYHHDFYCDVKNRFATNY